MPSLFDVYRQVCTHEPPFIPASRHKDMLTALKYLAASHDSTPERLSFTPQLEADYRGQLTAYFQRHPKGYSTVRNTKQALGQLWKAYHQLEPSAPVPVPRPVTGRIPTFTEAKEDMKKTSPYRYLGLLRNLEYTVPESQWPTDIAQRWKAYRDMRRYSVRPNTMQRYTDDFQHYLSYQLLAPHARLARLPDAAQATLPMRGFQDDLDDITIPPALTMWDELFELRRLHSYVTWHAWRVHPWHDPKAQVTPERKPSRPNARGEKGVIVIEQLAKFTHRPEHGEILHLWRNLPARKKIHNKTAEIHRFEFAELESIAQALMDEARRMQPRLSRKDHSPHPGNHQAAHFATGLILALAWRNPLRARNWCEALLDVHLKKVDGQWCWRLAGHDLKVAMRDHGTKVNVFEPVISPDIAPAFEEYLRDFRPHQPNADRDQHVFLTVRGTPLHDDDLRTRLKTHIYRFTGRFLYTHLLRSLFTRHHLTNGVDINSVAYALNDTPKTVLDAYNELMEDKHRPIIEAANRQALLTANAHVAFTPPDIPVAPKVSKPRLIPLDLVQLSMEY